MMRWAPHATAEARRRVRDGLAELPGRIGGVRSFTLGEDAGLCQGNLDFVLVVDFIDRRAFLNYINHPLHESLVRDLIAPIRQERAAVQIELPD